MFFYFDVKAYSVCIWGSSYVIKKIDILISDGKNSLKLPGDHIDFNLNHLVAFTWCSKKHFYKKGRNWNFWFIGLMCSVRHEIQGDKRIEIMS